MLRASGSRKIVRIAAALLTFAGLALAGDPLLDQAHKYYNLTNFERSLQVLNQLPQKNGAAWALIGRNYYMQARVQEGHGRAGKGRAAEPDNAEYVLWLGRAFGRRAETSSPFTAPGYASKARQYFERAVQLNPRYLEALNDLFEYYLEAPGFLGGGMDKAQATAARIAAIEPGRGALGAGHGSPRNARNTAAPRQHLRSAMSRRSAAGGPLHRPGPVPGQAGPLPGGRPELRSRRRRSRPTARS